MGDYLPLFRPAETVTFSVSTNVIGGQPVQVGAADRSVAPADAATKTYVGVAGHDAKVGDKVVVEVGKTIHELTAAGALPRGSQVESAGAGRVRVATTGTVIGLALSTAADGAIVQVLQA